MDPSEDSWESLGWDAAEQHGEPDREQLLGLARRLAEQRHRQRTEDLVELEEMKRALRDRAADVSRRELDVERRERELEAAHTRSSEGRRALRIRRPEPPPSVDADRAYAEELLTRREKELDDRLEAFAPRERGVIERETALRARELKTEEALAALALREQRLARRESSLEQQRLEVEHSSARLQEDSTSLEERQRLIETNEANAERARQQVSRLTDELVRRTATLEAAEHQLSESERLRDGTRDVGEPVAAESPELHRAKDERERELAARAAAFDKRDGELAAQAAALDERRTSLEQSEREFEERRQQLARRETDVAAREAEVLRLQAGLAAQQESILARERSLEDAERMQEREQARPTAPYVSFAEGLDALSATRRRG
jgi:hypothetical protein